MNRTIKLHHVGTRSEEHLKMRRRQMDEKAKDLSLRKAKLKQKLRKK